MTSTQRFHPVDRMGQTAATCLTIRFVRAVDYVRIAHATQRRKGTDVPYISHLLGVASLVLDYGGDEDQVIAALMHDLLEDCGEAHEPMVRAEFGQRVADIVRACTDGSAESKEAANTGEARLADWTERKVRYLEHLRHDNDDVLLVSGCDKLHNARAILRDLDDPAVGTTVFDKFKPGCGGTLAFYAALADTFTDRGTPMARDLMIVVKAMHERVKAPWKALQRY